MSVKKIFLSPVPSEMVGLRLDKALTLLPEISSRSQALDLISSNFVMVNLKSVKASYKLQTEDELSVELAPPPPTDLVPWDFPLEILFEDTEILVVNKPAGMVVHPAAGHYEKTLVNALIHHTKSLSEGSEALRPGLVHRIDKETSGLLVIAKNNPSHEFLAQQFKDRSIHRKYLAVVSGEISRKEGFIESYLARHPNDRKRFASVRDPRSRKILTRKDGPPSIGKWAGTHFKVLTSHGKRHYLELKLETGRTHQIRVHLAEMGLPIVGDSLYGSKDDLPRFFLHAAELGFTHPQTEEHLFFKVDWPIEDQEMIQSWGLF